MAAHMTYDRDANTIYIRLDGNLPGTVIDGCQTVPVDPLVNLDYDANHNLIGIPPVPGRGRVFSAQRKDVMTYMRHYVVTSSTSLQTARLRCVRPAGKTMSGCVCV